MAIDRGLLAILNAKPGKGDELAAFLKQGRELALQEVSSELLASAADIKPVDVLAVK